MFRPESTDDERLDLSVVAPARDEVASVGPLTEEVCAALEGVPGLRWELVIVDDASADGTLARLESLAQARPWLRVISMDRASGQSAALCAGIRAARGALIATMDADLQNDPADLARLMEAMELTGAACAQGDRTEARRGSDPLVRRLGSVVGRMARRVILGDTIRDTGCSLRVMRREAALALPLELEGAHRFVPWTIRAMGWDVVEAPVNHRARRSGRSKYGMGIATRAIPGLIDCFAMRWLLSRRRAVMRTELRLEPARAERESVGAA